MGKRLLIVLILGWGAVALAQAQVRTPELNMQYRRAETAWKSGASVLEVKARVDRVLKAFPDDVGALKLRAQALLKMNRDAEALVDARRAVALSPKDGKAHLLLCEAARRNGDMTLAEQALDAAAELDSDDPSLHIQLSWNAMMLGRLDKALSFARVAVASDPNEAAAYYQLARVFVLKNQPDDAATVLINGLNASIVDPGIIASDTVLVRVIGHPALHSMLPK
ncbi:MAG: tetratricopeptide repeat protein [Rhodothermales bacterium]